MLKVLEITYLEQFLLNICREKNDNKIKVSNGSPEKLIFHNYCVWKKVIQGTVFAEESWFFAYDTSIISIILSREVIEILIKAIYIFI